MGGLPIIDNRLLGRIGGALLIFLLIPSCSTETAHSISLTELQISAFRRFIEKYPEVPLRAAFESYAIVFDFGDEIELTGHNEIVLKGLLDQREIIDALLKSISSEVDIVSTYEEWIFGSH